jgi:hypothetical protein
LSKGKALSDNVWLERKNIFYFCDSGYLRFVPNIGNAVYSRKSLQLESLNIYQNSIHRLLERHFIELSLTTSVSSCAEYFFEKWQRPFFFFPLFLSSCLYVTTVKFLVEFFHRMKLDTELPSFYSSLVFSPYPLFFSYLFPSLHSSFPSYQAEANRIYSTASRSTLGPTEPQDMIHI